MGTDIRLKKMPKQPLQIVCCVILDPHNRILLLQRHSEDLGGGLWAVPGGRQEANENPKTTAIRETHEETGLNIQDFSYLGMHELRMPHGTVHMKTYKAYVPETVDIVINPEEHESHHWFDVDSLIYSENIIWGLPTTLFDFGVINKLGSDPTLSDGSAAILVESC